MLTTTAKPIHFPRSFSRHRHLMLPRSEEHTSELQSQSNLVCRLLLEKKKNKTIALRLQDFLHAHIDQPYPFLHCYHLNTVSLPPPLRPLGPLHLHLATISTL